MVPRMTPNALADAPTAVPSPPTARKQPRVDVVHGERREDDYFWMREKSNPEAFIKEWWKGAALPDDLKLKDKKMDFGDLAP